MNNIFTPQLHSTFLSLHVCANVQVCNDIMILHLSYLAYPHYIITVHIYGLQSVVLDAIVFKVTHPSVSLYHDYTSLKEVGSSC